MNLKNTSIKSIALALASIIFISPILNMTFAMENELNNEIVQNKTVDMIWEEDSEIGEVYYVYKEEDEKQSRALWDFLDIGMAGLSWYDVLKDPSFKNIGWAVLDTAAIAPLIPSSAYIRKGSKLTVSTSSLKNLASTTKGKNAIKKALKVTKANSKLAEISKLAKNCKITKSTLSHIELRHAPSSKENAGKFASSFYKNIENEIRLMLKNDTVIRNNTRGRSGYIFEKSYNKVIGKENGKNLYKLRVILNEKGYVVTAFPFK